MKFFSFNDATHIITCITPCILSYIFTTDGNESLASVLEITITPNGDSPITKTVGGIPSILQSSVILNVNDTVSFDITNSGSTTYSLNLTAFAQ